MNDIVPVVSLTVHFILFGYDLAHLRVIDQILDFFCNFLWVFRFNKISISFILDDIRYTAYICGNNGESCCHSFKKDVRHTFRITW